MCVECAADPGRFSGDWVDANIAGLRVIFALTLGRQMAAQCLEGGAGPVSVLWPSSLYGRLALASVRSPLIFCRCAQAVEQAFGAAGVEAFDRVEPVHLVRRFVDGRDTLPPMELGSLLWALIRHAPRLGFVIARLAAELEVAVTQRAQTWPSASRGVRRPVAVSRGAGASPGAPAVCLVPVETRLFRQPANTR